MASAHEDDEHGAERAQRAATTLDRRWRYEQIRSTGCPVEIRLSRSSASGIHWTVQDIGRRWEAIIGACLMIDRTLAHLHARTLTEETHAWLTRSPSQTPPT